MPNLENNNKYTEGILIYCLVTTGQYSDLIFESLESKHFTNELYKRVFELGKKLWSEKIYSQPALLDELIKNQISGETLSQTLDATYMVGSSSFDADKITATVSYVKDSFVKKTIQAHITELSAGEIAELVQSSYKNEGTVVEQSSMDRLIKELIARDTEVIPYPFQLLNNTIGGVRKKEYTIVAARPSVGKTAFLEQIFWEATNLGRRCLFVSLEMSEEALFKRQILRTSGKDLFKNIVAPEDKATLYEEIKIQLGNSQIACGIFSPADIDRLVEKYHPDMVLIDYLQQILFRNSRLSEFDRVTAITKELAMLKQKYNIALVVASQYSRNAKSSQPKLSDLRSSGQIEQDADVVLSLWRDEKEEVQLTGADKIYIDCLKNRNGLIFYNIPENKTFKHQFCLMFLKEHVKFFDSANPDDIPQTKKKEIVEDIDPLEMFTS